MEPKEQNIKNKQCGSSMAHFSQQKTFKSHN